MTREETVEYAIKFFNRRLREPVLQYGERQALHIAISALREQGGSFQNGNDHKTVKNWPPYMDLPRKQETVTKCHDLYDEDGGEILAQESLENEKQATSNWVSVEERLPENNGKVLAFTLSGKYAVARYDQRRRCWIAAGNLTVTHWMPLPAQPKEEA